MSKIDKNDFLKSNPFSYSLNKDGKMMISYQGKNILILKGKKAGQMAKKLENKSDFDQQLVLAKLTGNFKRGNEKQNKEK